MGARGPAPHSAKLTALRGNPSDRPIAAEVPTTRPVAVDALPMGPPPDYLCEEGKREWLRVSPYLLAAGLQDSAALAAYCDSRARWLNACATLNAEGIYLTTEKGYQYLHPAVSVRQKCQAEMQRLFAELGLSPMGRQRLRAPVKPTAPIREEGESGDGGKSDPYGAGSAGEFLGGTG